MDYMGKKYNMLKILSLAGKDKNYNQKVFCVCDCGNFTTKRLDYIIKERTKSCGCVRQNMRRLKMKNSLTYFRYGAIIKKT